MFNPNRNNNTLHDTFLAGDESPFKESTYIPKSKERDVEREQLPKISFQKRVIKKNQTFYTVGLLMSLIALGLSIYELWYVSSVSAAFGALLCLFGIFYTEPVRWQSDRLKRVHWNNSVTLSVFTKSLHPKVFAWRKIIVISLMILLVCSSIVPTAFTGVAFFLFLMMGIVMYASRELKRYLLYAEWLSWGLISLNLVQLFFTHTYSFGLLAMAFILYQTYERLYDVDIALPEEQEGLF